MERPGVFLVSSIFWLRDESLEEFDNLPMFDEDLEAALEQFREIVPDLARRRCAPQRKD
jgi:hypothetical protein